MKIVRETRTMSKVTYVIALLLFSSSILQAQISGFVKNEEREPMEFVHVGLYQLPDSILIAGQVTNAKGRYSFPHAPSENLILRFSFIGYETICVSCKDSQEVILKANDFILDEVVVKPDEIKSFGAKDKLLMPQNLKEKSSSALTALGEMPQFQLNRMSNILQTLDHQRILILIDGIQANESELMSLSAKEISYIEYFTQPPARFADNNVGAVVNIKTIKDRALGFNGFINSTNSLTTGYGTNTINAKWYQQNHQLSLSYFIDYRNLNDNRINQIFKYNIENDEITNELQGLPGSYKGEYHIIGGDYIHYNDDQYLFSAKARYSLNPGREVYKQNASIAKGVQPPLRGLATKDLSSRHDGFSLALYYNKKLKNTQELTTNIVGTYYNATSNNQISQNSEENKMDYSYDNRIRNNSNSIIIELLYSKSFAQSEFSIGTRYSYKQLNQNYNENVFTNLNQQIFYLYSSLSGKVQSIIYNIGLGIEHSKQSYQDINSKHFTLFKPSLSVSYKISSSSSIRLNSLIQSNTPSIPQLTSDPIYLYYKYYSTGNPNLQPYYSFYNRLQYQYGHSSFYLNATIRHSYLHKPYMIFFTSLGDKVAKTWEHYNRVTLSGCDLNLQWSPFKFLKIQPSVSIVYTNAIKPDGSSLNDWLKHLSINTVFSYKSFSLLSNWGSSYTNLQGDITEKRMPFFFSELSYSKNNIYVSLQYIHNPNPVVLYSNNDLMNYKEETIWNNFQNLLAVSFRYNFTMGKNKAHKASVKLNNQDNVTGLTYDAIAK